MFGIIVQGFRHAQHIEVESTDGTLISLTIYGNRDLIRRKGGIQSSYEWLWVALCSRITYYSNLAQTLPKVL